MITLPDLFFVAAGLLGFLASITVWSPRRLGVKLVALGTTILFLPLSYLAFAELLSKPKPVALEWWLSAADEATVLGSTMEEGRGIYLWLQLAGLEEPRAYVLPWDRELAEQLQKAMREAEERRSQVRMRLPFEPSWDDREPKFYALPQPALPPKDVAPDAPQYYERPGTEA